MIRALITKQHGVINTVAEIAIVYDRSNLDSVIGAAMIGRTFKRCSYHNLVVHEHFYKYVFVGVEPTPTLLKAIKYKEATVLGYDSELVDPLLEDDYKSPTLIDLAIAFSLNNGFRHSDLFHKLSLQAYVFNNSHAKLDKEEFGLTHDSYSLALTGDSRIKDMAMLYKNYLLALETIDTSKYSNGSEQFKFYPVDTSQNDVAMFNSILASVKKTLGRVYEVQDVKISDREYASVTCFNMSQDSIPLAVKLASNVHKNTLAFEVCRGVMVVSLKTNQRNLRNAIKKSFSNNILFSNEAYLPRCM